MRRAFVRSEGSCWPSGHFDVDQEAAEMIASLARGGTLSVGLGDPIASGATVRMAAPAKSPSARLTAGAAEMAAIRVVKKVAKQAENALRLEYGMSNWSPLGATHDGLRAAARLASKWEAEKLAALHESRKAAQSEADAKEAALHKLKFEEWRRDVEAKARKKELELEELRREAEAKARRAELELEALRREADARARKEKLELEELRREADARARKAELELRAYRGAARLDWERRGLAVGYLPPVRYKDVWCFDLIVYAADNPSKRIAGGLVDHHLEGADTPIALMESRVASVCARLADEQRLKMWPE